MRFRCEMAALLVILLVGLLGAGYATAGQPIDSSAINGPRMEGSPGIRQKIKKIIYEYGTGAAFEVEKIEFGAGLGNLFLIKIGLADDCLHETRCIYALMRDQSDQIPFVTTCRPGRHHFNHQHRADGEIINVFEFICRDKTTFLAGVSENSIAIQGGEQQ